MSAVINQKPEAKVSPTTSEVLDQQWRKAGMSLQEIEQNKRVGDIFERLLASGRSIDEILAEWEGKSADEILQQSAA